MHVYSLVAAKIQPRCVLAWRAWMRWLVDCCGSLACYWSEESRTLLWLVGRSAGENDQPMRMFASSDQRWTAPTVSGPWVVQYIVPTMAATMKDPRVFFTKANSAQFEFVFGLYEDAVKLKAQQKTKKVEDFCKLDKW